MRNLIFLVILLSASPFCAQKDTVSRCFMGFLPSSAHHIYGFAFELLVQR